MITLAFKKLNHNAIIPTKAYQGDAGIDFYTPTNVILPANSYVIIDTGIASITPEGYALIILDRSSVGSNGVGHLAGVIDQGYIGPIKITLINHNPSHDYKFSIGDKIAQALLIPVPNVTIIEHTANLDITERGTKGFGSSNNQTPIESITEDIKKPESIPTVEEKSKSSKVFRSTCPSCKQIYPLRLYRVSLGYRWLCFNCKRSRFPTAVPMAT